jgi:hypothetical protein
VSPNIRTSRPQVKQQNFELLRTAFHAVYGELTTRDGQWQGYDNVQPFWDCNKIMQDHETN